MRRRLRWAITAGAACAATAAAAYTAYQWWYGDEPSAAHSTAQRDDDGASSSRQSNAAAAAEHSGQDTAQAQHGAQVTDRVGEVGAALERRWRGLQDIAYSTTLPATLPCVRESMLPHVDVARVTAALHAVRRTDNGDSAPDDASRTDKLALFEELKVLSFVRAIAATWLVSMAAMLLRAQLNILGRHLYLHSALSTPHLHPMDPLSTPSWPANDSWNPLPTRLRPYLAWLGFGEKSDNQQSAFEDPQPPIGLSGRAQDAFLAVRMGFVRDGVALATQHAVDAVSSKVASMPLQQPVSVEDLLMLMSDMHACMAQSLSAASIQNILMPHGDDRAQLTSDNGVGTMAEHGAVKEMADELHAVLGTESFRAALLKVVKCTAQHVAELTVMHAATLFPQSDAAVANDDNLPRLPLARVLALVSGMMETIMAVDGSCLHCIRHSTVADSYFMALFGGRPS